MSDKLFILLPQSLKFSSHNVDNCKLDLTPSLRPVVISKGVLGEAGPHLLVLLFCLICLTISDLEK